MTDTYSQNMRIREDLLNGKAISPISALNDYGCFRLSARIHDLRHKYGLPIMTDKGEFVSPVYVKKFAVYRMREEDRKRIKESEESSDGKFKF